MPSECVEVLYDYNYETAEGKSITIQKGDRYKLLARSTEEWWKVLRGDRDKFYVPANYVRVLSLDSESSSHYHVVDKATISIKTDIPEELDKVPKLPAKSVNGWSDKAAASSKKNNDLEHARPDGLNLDLKNSLSNTPSVSNEIIVHHVYM